MASSFSGKAGRQAAMWTADQAANQLSELRGIYGTGRQEADEALKAGFQPSLDYLNQYYGQGRTDLQQGLQGANQNVMGGLNLATGNINQGYGQAIDAANNFYGQGTDALKQSVAGWQPLVDQNMAGFKMYQNSLGLNGAEGNQAATNAFQAGPGYQWGVDQATGQAARAANKLGQAYSGNLAESQLKLANNLANQEYGNWQKNLSGFQTGAQSAQTGQSGALNNLASLYGTQGNTLANLYTGQGKDLSGLNTAAYNQMGANTLNTGNLLGQAALNQGGNLASLQTAQSQGLANNALGYMGNLAGANQNYYNTLIPAGNQGLMAGQQAAANRMGALMGGLQMGASLLGSGMGAGGFFTKMLG